MLNFDFQKNLLTLLERLGKQGDEKIDELSYQSVQWRNSLKTLSLLESLQE